MKKTEIKDEKINEANWILELLIVFKQDQHTFGLFENSILEKNISFLISFSDKSVWED